MVEKIIITIALILGMSAFAFSQETYTRHQLGIDASKFVVVFNEEVNNLDLTYRYSISEMKRLRFGSSLDVSTEEGDLLNYEVRLGYDFNIKQSEKWDFYTGIDMTYAKSVANSSQRETTTLGPYVFFGALFKMGKHFSLSTEPSLAVFHKNKKDPNSFNPEANEDWMEWKLLNIGQIKISFHL